MNCYQNPLLLLATTAVACLWTASASNVVIAGADIAVLSNPTFSTQQLSTGATTFAVLPSGITSFADVAVDPTDENKVFALSTAEQQVCSFLLDGTSLAFVNCVGNSFAVSPFAGVSAYEGSLIVSGGVGGLTVYDYNVQNGQIDAQPRFSNVQLQNVVGHPDVLLISSELAAMSTDFSNPRGFGTMMVDLSGSSPQRVRDFRVANSLNFDLSRGPANFPLVNAYYETESIMYIANGALTAQDPFVTGSTMDLSSFISNRAMTCAVDTPSSMLVVGEENNDNFFVEIFNIADPSSPELLQQMEVSGRLTSVVIKNGVVVYSTATGMLGTITVAQNPTDGVTEPPTSMGTPDSPTASPTMSPSMASTNGTGTSAAKCTTSGIVAALTFLATFAVV